LEALTDFKIQIGVLSGTLPFKRPFALLQVTSTLLSSNLDTPSFEKMDESGMHSIDRKIFNKVVNIHAPVSQVWHVLTTPDLMKKWMMPDIELNITTDWKIGSPMIVRGTMNGKSFENNGKVLQFDPEKTIQYTHLSSVSRLPDRPESYSLVEFRLHPTENQTTLTLTVSNFPTESIYQHLAFYWNVTVEVLKKMIEERV
jgi:uncharacterized protein YndB with AHSA1/START domain